MNILESAHRIDRERLVRLASLSIELVDDFELGGDSVTIELRQLATEILEEEVGLRTPAGQPALC